MLRGIFEFLGSPGVISQLRGEVQYLRGKIAELEEERKKLQDSWLLSRGAQPLAAPDLPPPVEQKVPTDQWLKEDMQAELEELRVMAEADPESWLPIYEETKLRYKDHVK